MLTQPAVLFLLLVLPIFALLLLWRGVVRTAALRRIGDEDLVHQLITQVSDTRRRMKSLLWMSAVMLVIIALARPVWGTQTEFIPAEGQQIVFVVDVSRSMDAQDISPSRLERAKLDIRRMLTTHSGADFGIVLFARRALGYMPLTDNVETAEIFVDTINTGAISSQGTNIPAALELASSLFNESLTANRTIIIMTDGENHEGDPLAAARTMVEAGIVVHTIGYGSEEGSPVPIFDAAGNIAEYRVYEDNTLVISRLGEDTLRQVARIGAGLYRRSVGERYLQAIDERIAATADAQTADTVINRPVERFSLFVALALLALSFEMLLPESRRKAN